MKLCKKGVRGALEGAVLVSGFLVSGCATITTGTDQSISVVSEQDVEGAKCELTDKKGRVYYIQTTPGTTSVHKGDGPMTVICRKDGYKTTTVVVDESFHGATLGNILLGGGIGIVVDSMSGAAQKYPDQVIVWMEPEEWKSGDDKIAWLEAKNAYEEQLEALKKAKSQATDTETDE